MRHDSHPHNGPSTRHPGAAIIASSEVLHVFGQRPLIVVAKVIAMAIAFVTYGQRTALSTVLTTCRLAIATIVIAKPEVMRLTPTINPSAQLAVPGHPLMSAAAKTRSTIPLITIH